VGGSERLMDYIASRVLEDGDCLRWTGTVCNGHPAGALFGKRCVLIRRVVWEQANGPIPPGKVIRCTCETPLCIALEHLKLSTYRQIGKECGAKGLMSGIVRSAKIAHAKRAGKQAKMTQEDARAIRASDESSPILAQRYGVTVSQICRIKNNQVRREYVGNVWAGLA
jgi:hypothetical protein